MAFVFNVNMSLSGNQLTIREDGNSGVNIPGLSVHRPSGPDHLLRILESGNANRTQHPTDANAESSRSHAVFQVITAVLIAMFFLVHDWLLIN